MYYALEFLMYAYFPEPKVIKLCHPKAMTAPDRALDRFSLALKPFRFLDAHGVRMSFGSC